MKKSLIIHPLLFAVFPILSLYDHNKDLLDLVYLFWPIIIAVSIVMAVFLLCHIFVKDKAKCALIASLFMALFLSFGHVLPSLGNPRVGNYIFQNHYILLAAYACLFVSLTALITAAKTSLRIINSFANAMGVILVIITLASIGAYEIKSGFNASPNAAPEAESAVRASAAQVKVWPDIYYIILDGYARADVLQKIYDHDNSEFLSWLETRGFYIADRARANYAQTFLSISSSLNFDYLDNLAVERNKGSSDRNALKELIRRNRVYAELKARGYRLAAFPSMWTGYNDNLDSDIYLHDSIDLNEFDNMLLATTPLYAIYSKRIQLEWVRSKFFYTLDHLPDLAKHEEPTFTYVHILSPHPPFLFDRDGNPIEPKGAVIGNDGDQYFKSVPTEADLEAYRRMYRDQLAFLNRRVTETISRILADSPRPPIIILQSDHGPGSKTSWESAEKTDLPERLSILNAYFVPDEIKSRLYPAITPVNTFRLIFNELFGLGLEPLPDRSYFSTWSRPYDFIEVTDIL